MLRACQRRMRSTSQRTVGEWCWRLLVNSALWALRHQVPLQVIQHFQQQRRRIRPNTPMTPPWEMLLPIVEQQEETIPPAPVPVRPLIDKQPSPTPPPTPPRTHTTNRTTASSSSQPTFPCPRCGTTPMKRRAARNGGLFLGCPMFPKCRGYRRPNGEA